MEVGMENVEALMTTNHTCCSLGNSLQEVSKLIQNNNCSEIIIIDNENDKHPIGIISEHDITAECAKGKDPKLVSAKDCMRTIPLIIESNMDAEQCLKTLELKKLQHAPVVDQKGKYCGMIASNDIAPLFYD
jgi:predicted transcriptional regulator